MCFSSCLQLYLSILFKIPSVGIINCVVSGALVSNEQYSFGRIDVSIKPDIVQLRSFINHIHKSNASLCRILLPSEAVAT